MNKILREPPNFTPELLLAEVCIWLRNVNLEGARKERLVNQRWFNVQSVDGLFPQTRLRERQDVFHQLILNLLEN